NPDHYGAGSDDEYALIKQQLEATGGAAGCDMGAPGSRVTPAGDPAASYRNSPAAHGRFCRVSDM
ncbi:hypothetical protein, partial [Clavibacter michiganensis]|uniref:hypothetical protein n=1 Tax=Clavibacter michiganensis TaxID=28447 RepID=UPI00292F2222